MADSPVVEAPAAAAAAPTIESLNRMMRSLIHSMYQVGETGLSTDEVREAGLDRYNGVVSAAALSVPAFQMLVKLAFMSDLEEDRPQHVNDRINNAIKAVLQFDPVFAREQAANVDMREVLERPEFTGAAAAAAAAAAATAVPAAAVTAVPALAAAPNINALMHNLAQNIYSRILAGADGEAAELGDIVEAAEMETLPNAPIQTAGLNEEYIEVILRLYKSFYSDADFWYDRADATVLNSYDDSFGEIFQLAIEVDRVRFNATVARVLEGDDALESPLLLAAAALAAAEAAGADAGAGAQDVFTDLPSIRGELSRVSTAITAAYMTRLDGEIEEIPKIVEPIFDYSVGEESPLLDYLLNNGGDGCVFVYRGHLMGLSKSSLAENIMSGLSLYYKCLREATPEENSGGFGPWEVVRQRYILLPLSGQFYVRWEEAKLLFGTHSLWELEDTETRIEFSASYRGAIAGGPVESGHHCQSGTAKQIRRLRPVKFAAEEEAEAEAEVAVPAIVKIRKDGVNTPIDVADSLSVASVRAKYAAAIGAEPSRVKFVVAGRYLLDSGVVIPGTIIAATVAAAAPADEGGGGAAAAAEGGGTRRGRMRNGRKTLKRRRY